METAEYYNMLSSIPNTNISVLMARQVFDSRGTPTVEATALLACGARGRAIVPSGASTGAFEAHELRDGGEAYGGRGVRKAVENIQGEIGGRLRGMDAAAQETIDRAMRELDGTSDKCRLGANAILSVSLACAKAAAAAYSLPLYRWLGGINAVTLPVPMMNIINGGAHAGNNIDIQEFMIVPSGAASFSEAMRMATEVYASLKNLLSSRGASTAVGDEGGFAPDLEEDEQALSLICDAIEAAGYRAGEDIGIALDAAAGEWESEGGYFLPKKRRTMTEAELSSYYERLACSYPIVSIEDPLGQENYEGFARLRQRLPKVQIVGDDLFVTNSARLRVGIERGSADAILIKPNQIGTLSETLEAIRLAQASGMSAIISHRSGETEDSTIADIAVASNAGQIKSGAPARSDRVAKYNRLLRIESQLTGAFRHTGA